MKQSCMQMWAQLYTTKHLRFRERVKLGKGPWSRGCKTWSPHSNLMTTGLELEESHLPSGPRSLLRTEQPCDWARSFQGFTGNNRLPHSCGTLFSRWTQTSKGLCTMFCFNRELALPPSIYKGHYRNLGIYRLTQREEKIYIKIPPLEGSFILEISRDWSLLFWKCRRRREGRVTATPSCFLFCLFVVCFFTSLLYSRELQASTQKWGSNSFNSAILTWHYCSNFLF